MSHGTFSGNPKTEWLPGNKDRNMRLLEDFSFTDPDGRVWPAPKGSIVNGASIPPAIWTIVGSPYVGNYRRASVVHDVACDTPSVPKKEADVMFYHACKAGGCNAAYARVLYGGVRVGHWDSMIHPHTLIQTDNNVLTKFTVIADELKALPDDATIEQMDTVIECAI